MKVPLIDVSGPRAETAAAIDDACRNVGFFGVVGHGVDDSVLDALFARTYEFFDLPTTQKERCRVAIEGVQRGYVHVGGEAQAHAHGEATLPDVSETFAIGREPDTNVWPDAPEGFRSAWDEAWSVLDHLAARVVSLCATALGLDDDYFADKVDRSPGTMRANHYPAVEVDPGDGRLRGGAHTDYGSITLLRTDGVPGLQVRDDAGEWHLVPPVPDGFVVNVGDLLARWTNDRWRSTWHRVVPVAPPPWPRRLSVAFFQTPNPDVVVECLPTCVAAGDEPRYSPVTSGAFFDAKIRSIYVGGNP